MLRRGFARLPSPAGWGGCESPSCPRVCGVVRRLEPWADFGGWRQQKWGCSCPPAAWAVSSPVALLHHRLQGAERGDPQPGGVTVVVTEDPDRQPGPGAPASGCAEPVQTQRPSAPRNKARPVPTSLTFSYGSRCQAAFAWRWNNKPLCGDTRPFVSREKRGFDAGRSLRPPALLLPKLWEVQSLA